MNMQSQLTAECLDWLNRNRIEVNTVSDRTWPNSRQRVYKLFHRAGQSVFLKQYSDAVKFNQAITAYQQWLDPELMPVPALICFSDQHLSMVVSDVGESRGTWNVLSKSEKGGLQFQAGQFLRQLHDIEITDDDPIPLGDAILARARSCQRQWQQIPSSDRSDSGVSDSEINTVIAGIQSIQEPLNLFQRVPCHRDFWTRNWIWTDHECKSHVDGTGMQTDRNQLELKVIDFEHARPDLYMLDVIKLWSDCWLENPEFEAIFWRGYGRQLSQRDQLILLRCAGLHALQTIIWSVSHSRETFFRQGRTLLDEVLRHQ